MVVLSLVVVGFLTYRHAAVSVAEADAFDLEKWRRNILSGCPDGVEGCYGRCVGLERLSAPSSPLSPISVEPLGSPFKAIYGDACPDWAYDSNYTSVVRLSALSDPPFHAEFTIVVVAVIGGGKSSLLGGIQGSVAPESLGQVAVVTEQVDVRIPMEETSALEALYAGTLCQCTFQQLASTLTQGAFLQASSRPGVRLVITERDLWSNFEIFARVCRFSCFFLPFSLSPLIVSVFPFFPF